MRLKRSHKPGYEPLAMSNLNGFKLAAIPSSKGDAEAAMAIAQQAMDEFETRVHPVLDMCDGVVREVIYVLANVGGEGWETSPEEVAIDFATGWIVGEVETKQGLAKPGLSSDAASCALGFITRETVDETRSIVGRKAIETGYFAMRSSAPAHEIVSRLRTK